MEIHERNAEPWRVTLIDTGENTMTGGRVKRVASYLSQEEAFCLTYGDGLSNVNISELIKFHQEHGLNATITATYPPGRFGALEISSENFVSSFKEKPIGDGGMINGGFFVIEPKIFKYIKNDKTYLEREPFEKLAKKKSIKAFKHKGFWQCMDTQRDKDLLDKIIKEKKFKI